LDQLLDASGLRCPAPIIEAAKAMALMPAGTVLRVLSTDPGIASDLPAWCEACGHTLLSLERTPGGWSGRIRKRAAGREAGR